MKGESEGGGKSCAMNIDWGFNGRGTTTKLADGAGANFENKHGIPKCWVVGLEREAARRGC